MIYDTCNAPYIFVGYIDRDVKNSRKPESLHQKQVCSISSGGSEDDMRANIKTNIKRGIAVGLIAIMAAINPMQTLQPTGAGTPAVAKAAEIDKAPYVGEVRLAVDSDPENAKRILISGGYEVIDQDLNEKAGSSWNELGDQAVYMGIKRTDDESKAIRDMKTMNMRGKYSFTDLKKYISYKTDQSTDMYKRLSAAIKEYSDNYKDKDFLAVKAHDLLNYIVEDDSGKKVGDLFLEDPSREEVVKMFLEGNKYIVGGIAKILALTSEQKNEKGDIWTERMSAMPAYNDIIKEYAGKLYGRTDVVGEDKARTENFINSDLDEAAREVLDRWDEIRSIFLDEKDMANRLNTASEDGLDDEEITELGDDIQNLTIVEYTKSIKYGKKTLYSFFKLSKEAFTKDITRLYPFVYALSKTQRKMLTYIDFPALFQGAITRMGIRDKKDNVESQIENYLNESMKDLSEISLYQDVDRAMYGPNAASTSRATDVITTWDGDADRIKDNKRDFYLSLWTTVGCFGLSVASACLCYYYVKTEFKDVANIFDFRDTMGKLFEYHPVAGGIAIAGLAVGVFAAFAAIYTWNEYNKTYYNHTQFPIPEVMVDFDRDNDAGKFITYHVVKWNRMREPKGEEKASDRADRGDLNGDAAREWLALYTTTEKELGDPILADSLVAKTGLAAGRIAPGENYVPLTMFGEEAIQNLVNENYSYHDEVDGIWVWYQKGNAAGETVVDDTEDKEGEAVAEADDASLTEEDQAIAEAVSGDAVEEEDLADTTGSNISSGSAVLIGLGGGVAGIIAGIFIGFFIRRKKQVVD